MPKSINNPKIPDYVRNLLKKDYAFRMGTLLRIESDEADLIEFNIHLLTEKHNGTIFDNIGQL